MTWTGDKIPQWLRRTPEQQAQDDRYQEQLRTAMGPHARPTQEESHLLHAQAVRISAQAQLEHLTSQPDPDPEHLRTAQAQLAEALAMQGQFRDAGALHPDESQAAHLTAIAEAIDRDDNDPGCNCPMDERMDEAQNRKVFVPIQTVTEMVFSPKHQRLMPLVKCIKCGDMNVKPAPGPLQERLSSVIQTHRDEATRRRGRPNVTT